MMEWRNKMFSLLYLVPCRRRPILEINIAYTKQRGRGRFDCDPWLGPGMARPPTGLERSSWCAGYCPDLPSLNASSQAEVVSGRGDGHAHEVAVLVHGRAHSRHDHHERVRVRRRLIQLRGMEEHDPVVRRNAPVVVLPGPVDVVKGFSCNSATRPRRADTSSMICMMTIRF